MKQKRLSLLLEKFENGTCSASELAELNSWYHSFTDHERALEEDLTRYPGLMKTLRFQLWNGIEEQIRMSEEPTENLKRGRFTSFTTWSFRIAAVLIIGILTSIFFFKFQESRTVSEFHTITTQKNNVSRVKLSDGTIIWVKAGSNLRYPEEFGITNREVFLEGEAFFDVAHQVNKPFLVHTSDLTIRVLGTAFNIKSYKDQGTIETTLVRGQVKIEKENMPETEEIILKPNERAIYNKDSKAMNIEKSIDVAEVIVKEMETKIPAPVLVFDETPFNKVFAQLEQRYHVKIHIDQKENLSCKLTADLQKEGLAEILQLLEVTHQIRYRIVGDEVYISGKLCH